MSLADEVASRARKRTVARKYEGVRPTTFEFFKGICTFLQEDREGAPVLTSSTVEAFDSKGRDIVNEAVYLKENLRSRSEMSSVFRQKEEEYRSISAFVTPERARELQQTLGAMRQTNDLLQKQFQELKRNNENISKILASITQELRKVAGVPPVGDVTLAFTDVQGSTSQWELHPKVMERALALHNRVIRKTIDKLEGYEVKTEGDAFMVAFQNPVRALRWALEVQEQLLEADWEEEVFLHPDAEEEIDIEGRVLWRGLRVRIGLHCGTPDCQPDSVTGRMDYFGQMVNKSARVEGGTHGGQVVVSEELFELVRENLNQLGRGVVVKMLGKYPLRGIQGETELIQIMSTFLSARAFPPPFKKYFPAPTGEITLCFTDVQGSTTQWEMHAHVMAKALSLHNQIMRRRLKQFLGYEVRTEGDAFMVAFSDPINAVNWALTIQLDLFQADWPEELYRHQDSKLEKDSYAQLIFRGYRVRVGINTGTPKTETDQTTGRMTYHGQMVVLAGGVEGLTNGGQINMSTSTYSAIYPRLHELNPHHVIELGSFPLKGAQKDETVYQILPEQISTRSWPLPGSKPPPKVEVPPPTGAVTLCNTDVQGSTTQWEMHPDVMQAGLAMHNDLMRNLIGQFNGYEVRTEGDAFFVAFQKAADAVNWALTAQEQLMQLPWPEALFNHKDSALEQDYKKKEVFRGMRVRIGIHTATPLAGEDPRTGRMDYYGPVTSHAHLVENAAHGGQIVISETVWAACQFGKQLDPHSSQPMGRFMFAKDDGIELFQILPESLKTRTFKAPPILHLRAAPRGEVTIVYTDVKGSTTQWEMHPPIMEKGLEIHNDIMRKRIQEMDGYEVKTEGDAFMVSFSSAVDAVRWALAIQVDLLRADWPNELFNHPDSAVEYGPNGKSVIFRGMRVRVGIHTGNPKCDPDPITSRMDYFGPDVNRAAGVEGATQGGQILMSGDTWAAIQPHIQDFTNAQFLDLGKYMLGGKEETLVQALPNLLTKRSFRPPLSKPPESENLSDLTGKLGQLAKQNEAVQNDISSLEKSLEASNSRLASVRNQVFSEKRSGSASAVLMEVTTVLQKQAEIQEGLSEAGSQQRQVTGMMEKVNRLIGSLSSKIEDSFAAKGQIEEESRAWGEKFMTVQQEEKRIQAETDDIEARWNLIVQNQSEIAEARDKIDRMAQMMYPEEERKLALLEKKYEELSVLFHETQGSGSVAAKQLRSTEEKHGELKQREAALSEELATVTAELEGINSQISFLEQKKTNLEEEAKQTLMAQQKKLHFQAKLSILMDEVEELQNALKGEKEGVPEAVNHFSVKRTESTKAYISWKPPPSKTKIESYAIYIRELGQEKFQLYDYSTKKIVKIGEGKSIPSDFTKLWIEGLKTNTNYELKLRASNSAGWGRRSIRSVQFATLREGAEGIGSL